MSLLKCSFLLSRKKREYLRADAVVSRVLSTTRGTVSADDIYSSAVSRTFYCSMARATMQDAFLPLIQAPPEYRTAQKRA